MFSATSLQIGSLSSAQMSYVAENLLSIEVSYSMDMANQLTFAIIDPAFEFARNNYFQVGRDVLYETTSIVEMYVPSSDGNSMSVFGRNVHLYEISSVSVSQDGSASPQWSVEAMPKAIQQMKRDKKPGSIGGSGYEFVKNAAFKYGLKFVGEKSSRIKGQQSQNSGDGQQDSVWDVISNIASQSQYVVFVQDGVMYFATQTWLMYKWGTVVIPGAIKKDKNGKEIINPKTKIPEKNPDKKFIPMEYVPQKEKTVNGFEVLKLPQMTKRENDPMEGEGSLVVARDNGVRLRPGMTIRINNIPTMNKYYLITEVSFSEQVTEPVSVSFRTPERLKTSEGKEPKIPQIPIGKTFPSAVGAVRPMIGATSIGLPISNVTPPPFNKMEVQTSLLGPSGSGLLPSARKTYFEYDNLNDVNNSVFLTSRVQQGLGISSPGIPVQIGNIDLWNRPVYPSVEETYPEYSCVTSVLHFYEDITEGKFVILERLWCVSGVPQILSTVDAENKYLTEGIFHGKFSTLSDAQKYSKAIIAIQKEIVEARFPKSYKEIWTNRDANGNLLRFSPRCS